jgi:hypothetical protein
MIQLVINDSKLAKWLISNPGYNMRGTFFIYNKVSDGWMFYYWPIVELD